MRLLHILIALLPLTFGLWRASAEIQPPSVTDPRLQLGLFASEPDIVTPIGLAVDQRNRIFVLESHTHTPPKGYPGPTADRIKIFIDDDQDGKPDKTSVFADDIREGMNLAFSPEGKLYVVCSREVLTLEDQDDNGVSESRTQILRLATAERYAHNSFLSIAFSQDGWTYVGRGNTAGHEYAIQGSDASAVRGYGDGGNIIRCRPDGSRVELLATGFWNPFGLEFDFAGRLLCVDNDPDSRGPNRLLHIVQGGDYGYKSLYGGSGLHPYQGWDGELPGTLPMIGGVGEAPSGLLDCSRGALPEDYQGNLLVTVWGEHTITRFRTMPSGISLRATNEILVRGSRTFRPVAIDADQRGNIYVTDWVEREYPNHGKGRIWRLAAKSETNRTPPRPRFRVPVPTVGLQTFNALLQKNSAQDYASLRSGLTNGDPFIRTAVMTALTRPAFRAALLHDLEASDPRVRLGALLALRRAKQENPAPLLKRLLRDPDAQVRRMALIWTGEETLTSLRGDLDQAISTAEITPNLFETYLSTVQNLSPEVIKAYERKVRGNDIRRRADPKLVAAIAQDASRPTVVRALALAKLEPESSDEHFELLTSLVRENDSRLRLEAVRSLAGSGRAEASVLLLQLSRDGKQPSELRAESVLALTRNAPERLKDLVPLLNDSDTAVQIEAIRALRPLARNEMVREALSSRYRRIQAESSGSDARRLIEQLEFALFPDGSEGHSEDTRIHHRPSSPVDWRAVLAGGGDPASGRRVFFSAFASCAQCHQVQGHGGLIGPDLSVIGSFQSRERMMLSILRPSDEISPLYQGWFIETKEGESHSGLQLHHKPAGAIDLIVLNGTTIRFPGDQIADYGMLNSSLMPDGLENTMTVHDFLDLLAFLESLK
ncbi:MAG: dehydrogenase [Verrucomicrobia bacterium]|nr:dehydrogenase [Verrucomicrobiota bacterium]